MQTFVIIGKNARSIDEDEAKSLLLWVERGGRLVLVDRMPEARILRSTGGWVVTTEFGEFPLLTVNPGNVVEMTEDVKPIQPIQPTLLTQNVESVMPSRFAATLALPGPPSKLKPSRPGGTPEDEDEFEGEPLPTPEPVVPPAVAPDESKPVSPAPVVHLGDSQRALLVDYPLGNGRIVILSDPYIFSNGGLNLLDNLQLARNLLTSTEGLIAFDEYHQGKGISRNALIGYFSGTPILPILGQLVALILVILWTRSRRFARPLPLKLIDRRSSLEFVASMAELQERARAFDLAIENVYLRTRQVLARYAGMEYNSPVEK